MLNLLSVRKMVKNPAKATLNTLLKKGSNINTKRNQKGMIKNKVQVYNNKTKRWVVKNTKTGKFERQGSRKAIPYKNIRKV